jgi:hypothetical protein
MKVRANMKQLVNLLTWATLGSLVAVSVTAPKAGSVTINGNFIDDGFTSTIDTGDDKFFEGGAAPNNAVGEGNLFDIFEAAADWWELAIQDDFTLNIDYGWAELGGSTLGVAKAGLPELQIDDPKKPIDPNDIFPLKKMIIQFDNDGIFEFDDDEDGIIDRTQSYSWFLDSTPNQNEEFEPIEDEESTIDLGGGNINIGRVYTAKDGDASEKPDLLTTALHEIGHALGFGKFEFEFEFTTSDSDEIIKQTIKNPEFKDPIVISEPLPFKGTQIPTTEEGGGHIEIEIPGESEPLSSPLLFKSLSPGRRKLPSEVDILGVAQVSGFEDVNLNPVHTVPEPLTILGSVTALGFGTLLKREHSRRQK